MRGLRLLVLPLATAACALASPAVAAGDLIAHGRAIGAIAIGDERAAIAGRVGDGIVIARSPSAQAPGNSNLDAVTVAYPRLSLVVRFDTDEASAGATVVSTRSARYRTAGGIGVGSPRPRLTAAHPHAVCGPTLCRVGPRGADRRVTRFTVAGRVLKVEVLLAPRS